MRALLNVKFPVLMLLSAILTLQLQSVSYFILQIGSNSPRSSLQYVLCTVVLMCCLVSSPIAYADLLDGQTVPSLLSNQLLETRNGQPQGKNDLPASFLSLNWSSVQKNGHPGM